jgi:hypothetical protein
MTLVRRATLLTVVGLLAASAAMAGVPSAGTSTQPVGMKLVELSSGVPNPTGNISYTIRDASSNPVPGSVVILNFANCHDTHICSAQGAGVTLNCAAKSVTAVTNATGQVTIVVAGNAFNGGVTLGRCVSVTADGVPLSNLSAATPDLDQPSLPPNGMSLADVAACYGDFISFGQQRLRSDLNGSGAVDLADVAIDYSIFLSGPWPPAGTDAACGAYCP